MVAGVSPGGYRGGDGLCSGAGLRVQSEVCGGGRGGQHQHLTEGRKDSSAPGRNRNPEESVYLFIMRKVILWCFIVNVCVVLCSGADHEGLWLQLESGP